MSEFEPQLIELAGRRWSAPRLPWRLSRQVQPALMSVYRAAGGEGATIDRIAALEEAELERLAEAVFKTVRYVEPTLTREAFDEMPIGVSDLVAAFPAVARCAGMNARAEGGAPGPKALREPTGTA